MPTTHPTTAPARRDKPIGPQPRYYHRAAYTTPDNTIHTYCGLTLPPSSATNTAARARRLPCPACDAAAILYEVNL